jgi:uncharacterized protein (UPF0335 family)
MPEQQTNNFEMGTDVAQKMTHIEDKVNDLSTEVKEMRELINKIYVSVTGDEEFGHKGLVKRVESLELTKKKWENKVNWMYGYALGVGSLLALGFELVKTFFK